MKPPTDMMKKVAGIVAGVALCQLCIGRTAAPFDNKFLLLNFEQRAALSTAMYIMLACIFVGTFPHFVGRTSRRGLCALSVCFLAWLALTGISLFLAQTFETGQESVIYVVAIGGMLVIAILSIVTFIIRSEVREHKT